MESGAHMYNKDRDVISKPEALASAQKLAEQLKCNTTEQWLQCLRGVDPKEFIKIVSFLTYPVEGTEFLPISYNKLKVILTGIKLFGLKSHLFRNGQKFCAFDWKCEQSLGF